MIHNNEYDVGSNAKWMNQNARDLDIVISLRNVELQKLYENKLTNDLAFLSVLSSSFRGIKKLKF